MPTLKSILVASDLGDASRGAIEQAFQIAASTNATVHLAHVMTPLGVQNSAALPPQVLTESDAAARRHLRAVADERQSGARVGEIMLRYGPPATAIIDTAREVRADLIVLGSHNRRGVTRMLLGSVAEDVARRAPCSVLIARSQSARET